MKKTSLLVITLFVALVSINELSAQNRVSLYKFSEVEFIGKNGKLNGGSVKILSGAFIHWTPKLEFFGVETSKSKFEKFRLDGNSMQKIKDNDGYITYVFEATNLETNEQSFIKHAEIRGKHYFEIIPFNGSHQRGYGRFYRCSYYDSYLANE